MRYKMNRNDLKEYFTRLKKGQQDAFVSGGPTKSGLLSESHGDSNDPYNPDANPNLVDLEMNAPIGGGLGRGLDSAKQKLKKALSDLYQEVVDGVTDEYGDDETDGTNQIAYEETDYHVSEVVKDFMFGISVPSEPYGDSYKDEDEDSDPIRGMGFSDYQSNNPEDEGYSKEYERMLQGRPYDK